MKKLVSMLLVLSGLFVVLALPASAEGKSATVYPIVIHMD